MSCDLPDETLRQARFICAAGEIAESCELIMSRLDVMAENLPAGSEGALSVVQNSRSQFQSMAGAMRSMIVGIGAAHRPERSIYSPDQQGGGPLTRLLSGLLEGLRDGLREGVGSDATAPEEPAAAESAPGPRAV